MAMERTGVFRKPVWNPVAERFTRLLVNAEHCKTEPGRRTESDAARLAQLLRHSLLRASFVPDRPVRELRELTRYRSSLVHLRTAGVNRKTRERGRNASCRVASSGLTVPGYWQTHSPRRPFAHIQPVANAFATGSKMFALA